MFKCSKKHRGHVSSKNELSRYMNLVPHNLFSPCTRTELLPTFCPNLFHTYLHPISIHVLPTQREIHLKWNASQNWHSYTHEMPFAARKKEGLYYIGSHYLTSPAEEYTIYCNLPYKKIQNFYFAIFWFQHKAWSMPRCLVKFGCEICSIIGDMLEKRSPPPLK